MLSTELSFSYRVLRRGCVSLYSLYGGEKEQRQNFTRVPPGSVGLVTHECTSEEGALYFMVRFQIGTRCIHVRCAPAMVKLDDVVSAEPDANS